MKSSSVPLEGGKELRWGYEQASLLADHKLLVNINPVAAVFYSPGPLMHLATAALGARGPEDVGDLQETDLRKLARALRKIEVVPIHRTDRKRAISGVSVEPADKTLLDMDGVPLPAADYFSNQFNLPFLLFPNFPLVNVGRIQPGQEIWLPIELSEVVPGQRCGNVNDLDTAEIIRQTRKSPRERKKVIEDQVRQTSFENDPYLAAFGVKVDQRLETTDARVIDPPEVRYPNLSERLSGGPLNSRRPVDGAILRNWGIVITTNVGERDVQGFVGNLVKAASRSRLTITDCSPHTINMGRCRDAQVEDLTRTCFNELEARNKGPPQLIVVILAGKPSPFYPGVKRSEEALGIPCQALLLKNFLHSDARICTNLCQKINMMLNGENAVLRERLPLVDSSPTIIVGATHPRSGEDPLLVAVVASLDRHSAKYETRVAAQKTASGIQQLPFMLRDLFLSFNRSTGSKPEHVVYYRDGVTEDQFLDVLQAEMRALREAFKLVSDGYNPPVTFIFVNKCHHLCAFPANLRDADRNGNALAGTVIDVGIVDAHRMQFYLYGHRGIQGTSVPYKYTVLHNENSMSAEDVQRLTFYLGYTSTRYTRSVSVVPPVYFAQLAAARALSFPNKDSGSVFTVGSFDPSSSSFEFTTPHEDSTDKNCFSFRCG